jgi:hypothetical protein
MNQEIFELVAGDDEHMMFLPVDKTDFNRGVYAGDGAARVHNWYPPSVRLQSDPFNKGKQLPDIGHVAVGSIVLSQESANLLKESLEPFGELLPIDAEGTTYYLYNVTTIIDALDPDKTIRRRSGLVKKPVFDNGKIPDGIRVFKIPETQVSRLYVRQDIKALIERYGLTGARFVLQDQI